MTRMKPVEHNGYEKRTEEIRIIWKEHQWLYVFIGLIVGLLISSFIQADRSEFLLNLVPEAVGISFGVFVVDRLYRYWERQRIQKLIRKEIITNLSNMVMKTANGLSPAYIWGMPIRQKYGQNGMDGTTPANGRQIKWLFMYTFVGTKTSQLSTDFIDSALTSDTLLSLGNINSANEITLHEALLKLRNLINQRKNIDKKLLSQARKYLDNLKQHVDEQEIYEVLNNDIYIPMVCVDQDINIMRWSKNIVASIDVGKHTVTVPILQPLVPVDDEAKNLSEETPPLSEVEEWILHEYDTTTGS